MKKWKELFGVALVALLIGAGIGAPGEIFATESEQACNHTCAICNGGYTQSATSGALSWSCGHVHDETCGYSYNAETNTYEVYTAGAMQAAIDAAEVSGTTQNPAIIKLMANLDLPGVDDGDYKYGVLVTGGVIIIDLNGYTLNGADGYYTLQIGAEWGQISNARVTITDSSNAGTGVISNVNGDISQESYAINNLGGWLIVNKGAIIAEGVAYACGIWNTEGTVIINDGNISASKKAQDDSLSAVISFGSNAAVIMKGGTISAEGSNSNGIDINDGLCTITGGTITSNDRALLIDSDVKLSITGGSFNGGKADICTLSGETKGLGVDKNNGKGATFPDGITVENNTLNAILATGAGFYDASGNLLTVADSATSINETVTVGCAGHTGGTATCVSGKICEICGSAYGELDANNHGAMDPATGKCSNGCGNFLAVASVTTGAGTTYFAELQAAIDAAEISGTTNNPATIKLMANLDLPGVAPDLNYPDDKAYGVLIDAGVMKIDLNGFTLSNSDAYATIQIGTDYNEPCGAVVTIMDSSAQSTEGTGAVTKVGTVAHGKCSIINYCGTLFINSGTIKVEGTADAHGVWNTNGKVTVNGGKIYASTTSTMAYGIYSQGGNNPSLTVNGGEISGNGNGTYGYGIRATTGAVTIKDGTIAGGKYALSIDINVKAASITGGSFTGSISTYTDGLRFLGIDENGKGATFPDGITVKNNTLKNILAEGAGFYDASGNLLTVADDATSITGTVTVGCDHSGVKVYSASGNVIKETCEICETTFGTVTVTAQNATYDGTAKEVTVTKTGTLANAELTVAYYEGGILLGAAPVNAGTYTAKITYNEKTASIDYTIAKATPYIIENPTAGGITYGQPVSASTLTGGKAQHSDNNTAAVDGSFSWNSEIADVIPTVADGGVTKYTVTFTPADAVNYNSVTTQVTLNVENINSAITVDGEGLTVSASSADAGDEITVTWNVDAAYVDDYQLELSVQRVSGTEVPVTSVTGADIPDNVLKYTFVMPAESVDVIATAYELLYSDTEKRPIMDTAAVPVIDFIKEKIEVPAENMEYSDDITGGGWYDFIETLTAEPGACLWFRTKGSLTGGVFTPASACEEIRIPTRPVVACNVESVTATSIVMVPEDEIYAGTTRYGVGLIEAAEEEIIWQTSNEFTGLQPNANYLLYVKIEAKEGEYFAFGPVYVVATTLHATPVISEVTAIGTYGDHLSEILISGTANFNGTVVDGHFTWDDENADETVPEAGIYTEFTAKFCATNTMYAEVTGIPVTLVINKVENAPDMPPGIMDVSYETETVGSVTLPDGWAWAEEDASKSLTVGEEVTATAVYTGLDKGNYVNETVVVTITRSTCSHSYTSEVTKQPTVYEEGEETYTCGNCGHSYTEAIAKLEPMPTITPGGGGGSTGGGYYPSDPVVTPTPVPTAVPTPIPTAVPTSTPVPTHNPEETWVTGEAAKEYKEAEKQYDVLLGTSKKEASMVETLEVGMSIDLNFYGVKNWKKNDYIYKWTSSDESVAVVDKAGVVTMLDEGIAIIRLDLVYKVTGEKISVAPMLIGVPEAVYDVFLGTSAKDAEILRKLAPGEPVDLNFYGVKNWKKNNYEYQWISSDEEVATVGKTGVVTAKKPGMAIIRLKLKEKTTGKYLTVAPVVLIVQDTEE